MKKNIPLIIILLIIGFCTVLAAGEKKGKINDKPSGRDSLKNRIRHLTENHQYDSALSLCSAIRKEDALHFDDLETALATIYFVNGDKATAYQYVLNSTNYLITNAAGNMFPHMLSDYDYAYPLATDSFLEKIVMDKVSESYSALHHFPLATSGLKFMLLEYRLIKMEAQYNYAMHQKPDKEQAQKLQTDFNESLEDLTKRYMDEIRQNDKLLTWKEAGPAFETQINFLAWINDPALHIQMQPYFQKAFEAGEIRSALYVDQLTWLAGFTIKDQIKLDQLHDSLCAIYNCLPVREAHYNKRKGDTLFFINRNRFDIGNRDVGN